MMPRTLSHPIALLLLLCLLPLVAVGQGRMVWLENEHDFGTVREQDGKLTCAMRFVNVGDSALVVTQVRTTCGCTASDYPHHAIAAGDTAVVTLTYNPAGRPGEINKQAFVYTNAQPRRSVLTIKGFVIASPETLLEQYPVAAGSLRLEGASIPLGALNKGRTRSAFITGYNASTDSLRVRATTSAAHLTVAATPAVVPAGGTVAITVGYDTALAPLWGLNVDTVSVVAAPLHPSHFSSEGDAQVLVMAQVTEDFSKLTDKQLRNAPELVIETDKVDFGNLEGMVTRTLTLRNAGHDPLLLRRVWADAPSAAINCGAYVLKGGKTAVLAITIDSALMKENVLNSRLTIVTNDPHSPQRVVRLVGVK